MFMYMVSKQAALYSGSVLHLFWPVYSKVGHFLIQFPTTSLLCSFHAEFPCYPYVCALSPNFHSVRSHGLSA